MTTLVPNANRFQSEERQELLLTMIRSASNDLRERALRMGAETLPEPALEALLREEADDVARNAGLEMLKLRGRRSFAMGVRLLADADNDVVLQAVLLLDSIGDPRAWSHVRPLLYSADENIVQAAIIAAGRLGSRGTADDLLPFLKSNFWLQMAALTSLGQLRSRSAVTPIAHLLQDDDLRDLAAEALARIGGAAAARVLSEHWRAFEGELDAGQWLPLIAQALADSEATPRAPLLRLRLIEYLRCDLPAAAAAAAAAILALGPGEGDGAALDVLVADAGDHEHLPSCLARRGDLAEWLVTAGPPSVRDWGYELFLRDATSIPIEALRRALAGSPPADLRILANIATRFADSTTLVSLFVRWPAARETVAPLLRRHRSEVLALVDDAPELGEGERLLLLDTAGGPPARVAAGVVVLPPEERAVVVAQLHRRRTIASLPWLQWIEEDRARFAPLLGEVVSRRRVIELLPIVRRELARDPLPELVACAGALRDRASSAVVIAALTRCSPVMRAALFDSIAAIGGSGSRRVLRQFTTGDNRDDARLAARALAQHATAHDAELLRQLAGSPDWAVRYSAADALSRLPAPENVAALGCLAADPSPVVAQRARAALDTIGGSS
jgi:HEAT repeat protein